MRWNVASVYPSTSRSALSCRSWRNVGRGEASPEGRAGGEVAARRRKSSRMGWERCARKEGEERRMFPVNIGGQHRSLTTRQDYGVPRFRTREEEYEGRGGGQGTWLRVLCRRGGKG